MLDDIPGGKLAGGEVNAGYVAGGDCCTAALAEVARFAGRHVLDPALGACPAIVEDDVHPASAKAATAATTRKLIALPPKSASRSSVDTLGDDIRLA